MGGEGGAAVDARFDAVYEGALWRRLDGDCMYARLDEYRYELCPFHNVTQRALRKNSLSVALGSAALKNANCIKCITKPMHTYAEPNLDLPTRLHLYVLSASAAVYCGLQSVVELVDDFRPSAGNELH